MTELDIMTLDFLTTATAVAVIFSITVALLFTYVVPRRKN